MAEADDPTQARDAARYAFLRRVARSNDLHPDGTYYWVVPFLALKYRAVSFDAAVDAAMAEAPDQGQRVVVPWDAP